MYTISHVHINFPRLSINYQVNIYFISEMQIESYTLAIKIVPKYQFQYYKLKLKVF